MPLNLPNRTLAHLREIVIHGTHFQLQCGQMLSLDMGDPLPSPAMGTNEWVVVPERHLHLALDNFDIAALPYERAGRFRIYQRNDVEPRALVVRANDSLLR